MITTAHLKMPSLRIVVENMSLAAVKLEKILAEGQSRVASYLDIRYPDGQDIIFLLGGKAVKAGRITANGREILTVTEALEKIRANKQGVLNFYEISKLLMLIVLGTFIFEPTHGRLKTKLINFGNLLTLFDRKGFTGYLELNLEHSLNYLTFFKGQPREGYFSIPATEEERRTPVTLVERLVESADENGEINLYESVGEEGLHEGGEAAPGSAREELSPAEEEEKAEFTAEILDLCLAAVYEDLFRLMSSTCAQQMNQGEIESVFVQGLSQASVRFPKLLQGAREREDGTLLPGGQVNFERLLKAKSALPPSIRDQEFLNAMNELTASRLQAMRSALSRPLFEQGLKALNEKISTSRKAYQGNFTMIKFLYEISRILEKMRPE